MQVFFAYAILTPDECTLFINHSSLTATVREYLHKSVVAVLDYGTVWASLETFGQRVKEQRKVVVEGQDSLPKGKEEKGLERTDKVLVGNKASWAVVRAVGEVRRSLLEEVVWCLM